METHQADSKVRYLTGALLALFMAVLVLLPSPLVHAANSIPSIRIEAEIQEDGSIIIRDHRQIYTEEGTEHYLSIGALEGTDYELRDVIVYDGDGQPLEEVDEWDLDASFFEKAGKYGVHNNDGITEISFGFGDYGDLDFIIEYRIDHFVFNLEDGHQGFYWRFIDEGMDPIQDLEIRVTYPDGQTFTHPEVRFWGFGHEGGSTEIQEDGLVMRAGRNFSSSDYVVLLAIFEGSPFQSQVHRPQTSEGLIEEAMVGASLGGMTYEDFKEGKGQEGSGTGLRYYINYIASVAERILFIVPFILYYIAYFILRIRPKKTPPKYNPQVTRDDYYREIPYQGHFADTQQLTNAEVADVTSAIILKWLEEGRLQDTIMETGFIFKKDRLALHIDSTFEDPDHVAEAALWRIVKDAAGEDEVLEQKEFNRFVRSQSERYFNYERLVRSLSTKALLEENCLEKRIKKIGFFGLFDREEIGITVKGQALLNNIQAFKNYLQDFSLIHEREAGQVVLWQDFFIWAAYLGIAEEFYEQFQIAEPEADLPLSYDPNILVLTTAFAQSVQRTAESERALDNISSTSSSYSGGGGSTFSGGGSTASGGGSGGGTR